MDGGFRSCSIGFLLNNLVRFGDVLHAAGLGVPAGRMIDVARALEHIDMAQRGDFHATLRSLLVHRPQDFALFDDAFETFWRRPHGEWSPSDLRAMGEQRRFGPPSVEISPAQDAEADAAAAVLPEPVERVAAMSYRDREVSRTKDFADFTDAELEDARDVIESITWHPGMRRTRRWRADRTGSTFDFRRLMRANARVGQEFLTLPAKTRALKRRPLVVIGDVSGSMERYARILLHFVHGVSAGGGRVETFLFSTQLTRVTRDLRRETAVRSLTQMPWRVPGWAGGTRIGDALHAFNTRWARRVMAGGPVVLLISDGWDRGEPDVMRREIARLRRSCHRLIWLNPLLGSPGYRPLTRGMQAALPFIDYFLPVHNLESLEALARVLETALQTGKKPVHHHLRH